MTKILLIGASLTKNLGGPSLFLSTRKILQAYIPDAEFTLWSPTPSRDSARAEEYEVQLVDIKERGQGQQFVGLMNASMRSLLWAALRILKLNMSSLIHGNDLLKEYAAADVVIDIWGIQFTDLMPSVFDNIKTGMRIMIGKLLGKPVILFTQDMGPFEKKMTRYPAKLFLRMVDLIFARSEKTQEYLRGIAITRGIHIRSDSAFVMDSAARES